MKGVAGPFLALALVVTASASAAQPASNGRILILDRSDLFTVRPDGDDRRQLTADRRNSSASFSPDGERIAFLKSDGSSPRDLYVMNADGSGGSRLIASHPETANAGGIHGSTWSPDSTRLAYFLSFAAPAIRVVDARDGTPFPLAQTGDPRPFGRLEWSPDGAELLYDDGNDVWIKPLDGRPARRVVALAGQDTRATWSPDGTRIAFIHFSTQQAGGVYVVRRDGTDLRHVAATGTALLATVRWKPDGTAVVFDATVSEGVGPRNIQLVTTRILFAGAEGSTIGVVRDHVSFPTPSPDNGQILIGRAARSVPPGYETPKPGVYAMNADGTCLTLVTTGVGVDWQRAPAVPINPRRECVDLVVSLTAPGVTGLRGVPYSVVARNEGTLTARDVRVRLSVDRDARFVFDAATAESCSAEGRILTCRIDGMVPRQTFVADLLVRPSAPGPLAGAITVSSAARDSDPASNEASARTRVRECWISGTDFNDRLVGTSDGEHICGHGGSDVIEALAGADVVDGGWQADTLDGGAGRDRVIGGRGNDSILARDGERDVIDCGWGVDRVFVDRIDRVLRGCEAVHRR